MQKVITVAIDHSQLFKIASTAHEIEHPLLKTYLEDNYTILESIPLTDVQDSNAGISIITFVLQKP